MMEYGENTLSKRGQCLALPNPFLKKFLTVFRDSFHPTDNPDGYVNAGIAENKLLHQRIFDRLSQYRPNNIGDLCYGNGTGNDCFKDTLLKLMKYFIKVPLDKKNLVVSGGCTASISVLFSVLCDTNDGVIVPTPVYGTFKKDLEDIPACRFVPAYTSSKQDFRITVEGLERAYQNEIQNGRTVRVLLLANPDNPTGRLVPTESLRDYFLWAKSHDLHVVVDEIYANSVFDGEFESALDIADSMYAGDLFFKYNIHVVNGFSKDFGMSGFRIGYIYSENPEVVSACSSLNTAFMVSNLVQNCLCHLYSDDTWTKNYIQDLKTCLKSTYTKLKSFLDENDIPFIHANSGIFVVLDLRKFLAQQTFEEEEKLHDFLFYQKKVYINNGKSFFFEEPGYFRMAYTDPVSLEVSMARLKDAFQEYSSE